MQDSKFKTQNRETTSAPNAARWSAYPAIVILPFAFCLLPYTSQASAQQLLDRVLARIGIEPITQTEVQAAVELGVVEAKSATDPDAARMVVERHLVLKEVARFPPTAPDDAAIDQEVAAMKLRAGSRLEAILSATGLDEASLREIARDTLRIRAYLEQRFGTATQAGVEEARKYYDAHHDEFTRDGMTIPFEQVEAVARQRASAERLRTTVTQWLKDLRSRSEVVFVDATDPPERPATPRAN